MMGKAKKGKFEWWKIAGAKEPFRWRLKASNGRIICQSEGYRTRRGCLNGIAAVQDVAFDADVVEV
jgi:uncharacterized protein YegP (UPF0339 family)